MVIKFNYQLLNKKWYSFKNRVVILNLILTLTKYQPPTLLTLPYPNLEYSNSLEIQSPSNKIKVNNITYGNETNVSVVK